MSNPRQEATDLLKSVGAELVRKYKHEVWRLPDGRNWVRSATPGDWRSDMNNLISLRKFLGVEEVRVKNPDRPEKKEHGGDGKRSHVQAGINSALADALRVSGAAESVLRERIYRLELELREAKENCDRYRRMAEQRKSGASAR